MQPLARVRGFEPDTNAERGSGFGRLYRVEWVHHRQPMGGDADLYADVLTWEMLLCLNVLTIRAYALIG
ncbi:hypothetical protein ACEWL3_001720 [Sulfitobacter sp. MF3-043]